MHPQNALIGTPGASAAFRSRYPSVVLDLDTMVVADAGVVTAGAAFAHIDRTASSPCRRSQAQGCV